MAGLSGGMMYRNLNMGIEQYLRVTVHVINTTCQQEYRSRKMPSTHNFSVQENLSGASRHSNWLTAPHIGDSAMAEQTAADPGLPGVCPIPVDENHVTICKPTSKEARIYRQVKRLIQHSLLPADHSHRQQRGQIVRGRSQN
jgi:hypothetical protein